MHEKKKLLVVITLFSKLNSIAAIENPVPKTKSLVDKTEHLSVKRTTKLRLVVLLQVAGHGNQLLVQRVSDFRMKLSNAPVEQGFGPC